MGNVLAGVVTVAVTAAVRELFYLLSARPAGQNNTNEELEQYFRRAHQAEADAKEMMKEVRRKVNESERREEAAKIREQEANQREEEATQREAEARRREEAAYLAAEQARTAAREVSQRNQEREEEATRREGEARSLADETKRVALEAQKREKEAKAFEKETRRREEEAKKLATKAQTQEREARKKLERVDSDLSKGIQPEVWPTEQEFRSAKARIQYDPEKLHFAICGSSGSGKSSLINALRGVKNSDPGAAATGVSETTMSVTRYPDPNEELPRSRFVWFDVPGAGTLDVPGWQYFNEQGLFVFDIIILVYDTRFTQIDVTIIQHCERYRIPLFLVRSKADIQIRNILGDQFGYDEGEEDAVEQYKRYQPAARQLLINSTRENLDKNLDKAGLASREVFIVSRGSMHALVTDKWNGKTAANVIDEANLLQAVLKAAHTRRYGAQASTKDHSTVVKQNMAASQLSTNAF